MDVRPQAAGRTNPLVLTPAQIVAVGLVAVSIGGAAWLLRQHPTASEVPLLDGTALDGVQLAAVEAALDRAGLTDYRTENGRLWVPQSRQSAYKRAVVDADALPKPWGNRFHEAIAEGGVWVSPAARADSLKVARQDELALVLGAMPGIERAAVLYDEARGDGFRQEAIKTASVGIRPAAGTELDTVRAHGIRVLVASSVAGLRPEHVAVTDLATGRVFAGALEADGGPGLDAVVARRMAVEGAIAGRLRQTLLFVPGVVVAVAVDGPASDVPPADATGQRGGEVDLPVAQAAANAPAEVGAMPAGAAGVVSPSAGSPLGAVRVTVSLPDAYLDAAVAAARSRARRESDDAPAAGELARGEIERVRDLVTRALPGVADRAGLEVLVTTHPDTAAPRDRAARADDAPPAPVAEAGRGAPAASPGVAPVGRESWMALVSVVVGTLAGLLWWAGRGQRGSSSGGRPGRWRVDPVATGDAAETRTDRRLAA